MNPIQQLIEDYQLRIVTVDECIKDEESRYTGFSVQLKTIERLRIKRGIYGTFLSELKKVTPSSGAGSYVELPSPKSIPIEVVRNKLSPLSNLVEMINEDLGSCWLGEGRNKIYRREIGRCRTNIELLSK